MSFGTNKRIDSRTSADLSKRAQKARKNGRNDCAPNSGPASLERIMQTQAFLHFKMVAKYSTFYSTEVPSSPDVTGTRVRHMSSALGGNARRATSR